MQENSQNISRLEEQAYEKVALELAENIRKEGLWTKALSVCEGHESKSKALYISYRAKQILQDLEAVKEQKQFNSPSSKKINVFVYAISTVFLAVLLVLFSLKSKKEYIDGRYIVNNYGTVTDITTNIIWKRCSEGQTWTGSTCQGEAKTFTWDDAIRLAKDGWRLPTVDELNTLVFCSSGMRAPSIRPDGLYVRETNGICQGDFAGPTINQSTFSNKPASWLWTSSIYAGNSTDAWFVNFSNGLVSHGHKSHRSSVRLVRDGH